MKVYISADIEGITGATHWDETHKEHADYTAQARQMTAEVAAACRGAAAGGADEILVKDAHASARNIAAEELPKIARLHRGWSGHPYMMVDTLDKTCDALVFIGYHSRAGSATSPLAHSMSGKPAYIKINERYASEFLINSYTAALEGVPVVFISGDEGVCREAGEVIPGITSVAVKQGIGEATINIHPQVAVERIEKGVEAALKAGVEKCRLALPKHFKVEIRYKKSQDAYTVSFFPGASLMDEFSVLYQADDYFDVLRLMMYAF